MKRKTFQTAAISLVAVVFWIGVWALIAEVMDLPFVLPSPWSVFSRLWELAQTADFYRALFSSLRRILIGFAGGMLLGAILGFLTYRLCLVRALISPLMGVIRATPVASFILVVLFWLENEQVPAFISLLMVLPIAWQNTVLGLERRDPQLAEMAKVFRFGKWKTFTKVDLPQVISFLISAGKTTLGLAWKAGVAAEVLALTKTSVGVMIYQAKMYLETVDLYAWTLAIILFSVLLEKLFFALLRERKG